MFSLELERAIHKQQIADLISDARRNLAMGLLVGFLLGVPFNLESIKAFLF